MFILWRVEHDWVDNQWVDVDLTYAVNRELMGRGSVVFLMYVAM